MAQTFLEAIGILQGFGMHYLLTPMLIFVVLFGILMKTRAVSDKMDVNGVIAFIVAILVALIPGISDFMYFFLPMAAALLIIMFGGVLLFLFFGASTDEIGTFFKSTPAWIFFAVMFTIIFGYSIQQAFPAVYPTPEMFENVSEGELPLALLTGPMAFSVIFGNPRVLGLMAFLLLIGIIGMVIAFQTKGD